MPRFKHIKSFTLLFLITSLVASGCTLKREGSGEETEEKKEAKKQQLESKLYLSKGIEFLKNGESTKGTLLLEKSLTLDTENETTYYLLASAYLQNKQHNKMIALLVPTLKKFPNNGKLPILLAIALKENNQLTEAFNTANRAIEINEAWQNLEDLEKSKQLVLLLAREIQEQRNNAK